MPWHPSGDDIRAARERIKPFVQATPLLRAEFLDRPTRRVFLKPENLQRTGSFKVRGAFNALAAMEPQQCAQGVITFSSGNHALALALACHDLGYIARGKPYSCTVVMPEDASALKVQRTKGLGAEVVFAGKTTEDRKAKALELALQSGCPVIPSYDHPAIVCGQGTLGLEIMDQWMGAPSRTRRLGLVAMPLGGGGLLSGTAAALRARGFGGHIYGIEPESGSDTKQSLENGQRVQIEQPDTVCDGLRSITPGAVTFPILQKCQCRAATVSDAQVKRAAYWLLDVMKLLVEPSGAVAVAAWINGLLECDAEAGDEVLDVVLILSGGNVEPPLIAGWNT